MLNPPTIAAPKTDKDDPRLGGWLRSEVENPKVVIIGFPSDEGVRRNGGRVGAAQAPDEIRKALYHMTPDAEETKLFTQLLEHAMDIGNVQVKGELADDQEALADITASYVEQGTIPIILGGGHETAYGHFLGYAKAELETAIFNLDAHTDVRPLKDGKPHSGSPFRQALKYPDGWAESYLVAGLQPHVVAKAHVEFIQKEGGSVLFRDETNITSISGFFHQHSSDRLMVTFDMDVVDQSQAPGVSAPCTNGLPVDLWLTAAYLAGRNEQVTSFDLSEFNPKYDRDGQTAKLAALTIWHFLLGLSQR
ncbi:formimidoylglutamase [Fodinibius salsisoli]|uniref:Formimidoylglutamase n=1 Tax=Fodinibius salsisoli TaxID=2820877 RepID=A0ABT3PRF8_9BACT|nr:formimidoylglutamase [Fodinibius salsisoli]MCW9708447.1 formimidoylglutamase [Fodinibius salsisoli]